MLLSGLSGYTTTTSSVGAATGVVDRGSDLIRFIAQFSKFHEINEM